MKLSPDFLLEGPRGRRLCLEIALSLNPNAIRTVLFWPKSSPEELAAATARLAAEIAKTNLSGATEQLIEHALTRSVDTAKYWQEPDEEDNIAALPEIRKALEPVAEHVLTSSEAAWWSRRRQDEQLVIDYEVQKPQPVEHDPRRNLETWGMDMRAEEVVAEVQPPQPPFTSYSNPWWSAPPRDMVSSVVDIPEGLELVENSLYWDEALAIPISGTGATFEITSADDWVALCREFPLDVTASRRHVWHSVTGRDGKWVMPDWELVAEKYSAVHLTVFGYLNAATRFLSVDSDTGTVLAGFDPDKTFWLQDVVREANKPRQHWKSAESLDEDFEDEDFEDEDY